MTKQSKSTKNLFIIAGGLAFLYFVLELGEWIYEYNHELLSVYNICRAISICAYLVLGIMLICRKNNIITTVAIVATGFLRVYWLYQDVNFLLASDLDEVPIIWAFQDIMTLAGLVLLALMSVLCMNGKKSGIRCVWFLPAALCFCDLIGVILLAYSPNMAFYNLPMTVMLDVIYVAVIALVGLAITKPNVEADAQIPDMSIPAVQIPVPQPVQAPVQQPVAPRPQPVQQPVCTQVPQQPVRPAPQPVNNATDEYETIRKYKALLDEGIITEEEFQEKKKKLLDI